MLPDLALPAPAAAQQSDAPTAADAARLEAERLEAERLEAERAEVERAEAERAEVERVEADRTAALQAALESAPGELAAVERDLIAALSHRNRAAGDLVVARLDLRDAQVREFELRDRTQRAARTLERVTAEHEDTIETLTSDAVAAYRAGSTTHTPSMMAMEAVVRSRTPRQFVDGLGYLRQLLPRRGQQVLEAEQAKVRAADDRTASDEAHGRAVDELADAEEALRVAEAADPRAQGRFAEALAASAARTDRMIGYADAQRAATEAAPPTPSTAENVRLAADLAALARTAAEDAERMRAGSTRIEAGKEGITPWQASRCPVDGPTRFVNDWGFPRTGGRSHEGTDVFAERGTQVVAMADGVVTKVSRVDAGLGGRSVTYEVDGYGVYNAHLDTVADVEEGDELEAGQAIGTVGTSGNAKGTPPHNHLGIYQPDGPPVNPYPLLRRACR